MFYNTLCIVNRLIRQYVNNIFEHKEIKFLKEKQVEVTESQAYIEAVAKMIEQNNLILLE
ncbi:hypothetical protein CN332_04440 [Bacillus thuringiensis]|nr:hypothetical protein CN332_04440 [Bacillus thuringiensis]